MWLGAGLQRPLCEAGRPLIWGPFLPFPVRKELNHHPQLQEGQDSPPTQRASPEDTHRPQTGPREGEQSPGQPQGGVLRGLPARATRRKELLSVTLCVGETCP